MIKIKKEEIKTTVSRNDPQGNKKEFNYDLPCRYCNFQLPLNPIFITDITEKDEKIYIAYQCPNCNINNTVLATEWIRYRQGWRDCQK